MRIVNNLLGNIPSLCSGRCRNKYMNGIETDIGQHIQQLEDMLMCDEIAEMLQISSQSVDSVHVSDKSNSCEIRCVEYVI